MSESKNRQIGDVLTDAQNEVARLQRERDEQKHRADALERALRQIRWNAKTPREMYERHGPTWTSRETGHEYEDTSAHLEFAEEIEQLASSALTDQPAEQPAQDGGRLDPYTLERAARLVIEQGFRTSPAEKAKAIRNLQTDGGDGTFGYNPAAQAAQKKPYNQHTGDRDGFNF